MFMEPLVSKEVVSIMGSMNSMKTSGRLDVNVKDINK